MNFFSLLFVIFIDVFEKSLSKIIVNQIQTDFHWIYLTKFTFHPLDGYIDIRLQSRENQLKFVLLNEQEWKTDLVKAACMKKEFLLNNESNETDMWSLSQAFTDIDQKYFILIKCNTSLNTTNGMYRIMLTNGRNSFTEHFSNDQRGILGLFIASTSIYTIIFLVILKWIHRSKMKIYLIVQLYLIAIICSWLNSLISLIFTLIFALTGNDELIVNRILEFFARFIQCLAQIIFLLVLIFCVKGYSINRIQWKKTSMIEIQILIFMYILMQIILLILLTIGTNQMILNENLVMIADCIQAVMYILSGLWFVISLVSTSKKYSNKELRYFWIFSLWFFTNALILLLYILHVLPAPQITILRSIQIIIQCLAYLIFLIIIRKMTCFLRTKLNQINITYIDLTASKFPVLKEKETNTTSNELTDLCSIDNTWASRFRIPMKSFGPLPRLEPRRDVLSNTLTKSSLNRHQPSNCHVPRRLPTLNHDIQ